MALTVQDIMELPIAQSFRLVAGQEGLKEAVTHVNLLDFEYDNHVPEGVEPDGIFDNQAIVVTSLLFAKDSPEKILPVVRQLAMDGVHAITIKEVYYKQLPNEVTEFANEQALPIFLFDSEQNYSENVVVGLMNAIGEKDSLEILEEKLENLLQSKSHDPVQTKLFNELFPILEEEYTCFYLSPKKEQSAYAYQNVLMACRNQKHLPLVALPYQKGILLTAFATKIPPEQMMRLLGIQAESYWIGRSKKSRHREGLVYHIRSAIYACNYGKKIGIENCKFSDLGFWQLLLPNQNNIWMQSFCSEITDKLRGYDSENNGMLYETVMAYVENDCDAVQTAADMNLHKNTVRYRIGRAKEILGYENKGKEFDMVLYFAIKFYQF